jgi:hypothetical protein
MGNFEPINAAILVAIAIVLGWYLKDRFSAMDARMDDMTKHIAETKTLVAAQQGRIDELSREVVGMRSDMVQIALAVGARARPEPA